MYYSDTYTGHYPLRHLIGYFNLTESVSKALYFYEQKNLIDPFQYMSLFTMRHDALRIRPKIVI